MKIEPTLFSFQVNVPHSKHGKCDWFMPVILQDWLMDRGLQGHYCGENSWGDGYTNGVSNADSVYMVRDAEESDGLAFCIIFPECKVHICEQFV